MDKIFILKWGKYEVGIINPLDPVLMKAAIETLLLAEKLGPDKTF